MTALLATVLLNITWQITAIGSLAWALSRWGHRLPPSQRHRLFALAILLCVSVTLIAASSFVVVPEPPTRVADTAIVAALGASQTSRASTLRASESFLAMVAFAYAAFIAFRMIRLAHDMHFVRKLRRDAREAELPVTAENALERPVRTFALARPQVLTSATLSGPVTIGLMSPAIILPERLCSEGSSEMWTAVFGHELAHIRRRDFDWNLLCEIATAPVAFHPAIAWMRRELGASREQACDEMVTEKLLDARSYARSLVSVAHDILAASPRAAFSMGIRDRSTRNDLEERIMTLLNRKPRGISKTGSVARAVLLIASAVTATSFGFTVSADEKPAVQTTEPPAASVLAPLDEPELSSPPYDARGKRDPFLNPLGQIERTQPVGLDVDSLELQGIVETPRGFTAMLKVRTSAPISSGPARSSSTAVSWPSMKRP